MKAAPLKIIIKNKKNLIISACTESTVRRSAFRNMLFVISQVWRNRIEVFKYLFKSLSCKNTIVLTPCDWHRCNFSTCKRGRVITLMTLNYCKEAQFLLIDLTDDSCQRDRGGGSSLNGDFHCERWICWLTACSFAQRLHTAESWLDPLFSNLLKEFTI